MEGYDYAWGFYSKLPSRVKAQGAGFVVRYLGSSSKCITVAEVKALHAAGLAIGLVYETTGKTWRGGNAAGQRDGVAARAAADKLGVPHDAVIWFAIDEDTSDYAKTNEYLAGCQGGVGPYTARLYAGFGPVHAAAGGGHWQTYAWSGGKISANAGLHQYRNGVTVSGVSMDRDRTVGSAVHVAAGWLVLTPTAPAPKPKTPVVAKVATVANAVANRDKYRLKGNASARGAAAIKYEKAEVHSGRSAWKDLCASLVRNAYGISASHWGNLKRTAASAWAYADAHGTTHTWYNPPAGVPLYWTGGSSGAGHTAVADGQGNCWTNDFGPNGYIGDGRVRLVPIAAISKHDPALKYRGWSETYLGVRIYS